MRSRARWVPSFAVGTAAALVPIACATSEELGPPAPTEATAPAPAMPSADASSADVAVPVDAHVASRCSKDGFCPVPLPIASPINAISASGSDDVWMTAGGRILHWDGKLVSVVNELGSQLWFSALWAETKDNVWALAADETRTAFIVRFAPPAAGAPPAIREYRTTQPTVDDSIWATPAGDELWTTTVASGVSQIVRFRDDGSGTLGTDVFKPTLPPGGRWSAVWGFAPNDVYVAGGSAIAHYDGTSWSSSDLGTGTISSLHGTPPGQPRQLWYQVGNKILGEPISTYLVPIREDGSIEAPIFTNTMTKSGCSSRIGRAVSPTVGWFSDGVLVCRWTGTKFELVGTAPETGAVYSSVSGIWAGGDDDVWVVGGTLKPADNFPAGGYAVRRTRTANGDTP
jgi:hypothetical protein